MSAAPKQQAMREIPRSQFGCVRTLVKYSMTVAEVAKVYAVAADEIARIFAPGLTALRFCDHRARGISICAATLNRRGGRAQGLTRDRTNRTLRPKRHEWSACAKAPDCSAALFAGFLATRW